MTRTFCDICNRQLDKENRSYRLLLERTDTKPGTTVLCKGEICCICADRVHDACQAPPRDASAGK